MLLHITSVSFLLFYSLDRSPLVRLCVHSKVLDKTFFVRKTFIQQEHIKVTKSNSTDISITKYLCFK